MKTRIISAVVMIIVVIGVLFSGYRYNASIIINFISLLAVAATYEILHHIVKIGSVFRKAVACVYAMAAFFSVSDILGGAYSVLVKKQSVDQKNISLSVAVFVLSSIIYTVLITVSLIYQKKDFDIKETLALIGAPFMYSAAFSTLECIITKPQGIYYLLLVVNFSSVCDTGAYFTGVLFGKHKLCERVSPKKTVEGAVGGIVLSMVVTAILAFAFRIQTSIFIMLGVTAVMCIVGMLGDLFASIIKRSVGVKDYSNLIPGHGGILDRFDSMLFISPAVLSLMLLGVL